MIWKLTFKKGHFLKLIAGGKDKGFIPGAENWEEIVEKIERGDVRLDDPQTAPKGFDFYRTRNMPLLIDVLERPQMTLRSKKEPSRLIFLKKFKRNEEVWWQGVVADLSEERGAIVSWRPRRRVDADWLKEHWLIQPKKGGVDFLAQPPKSSNPPSGGLVETRVPNKIGKPSRRDVNPESGEPGEGSQQIQSAAKSSVDAAAIETYLHSGGAPQNSTVWEESERISRTLAQRARREVAAPGGYTQGDLFGGQEEESLGHRTLAAGRKRAAQLLASAPKPNSASGRGGLFSFEPTAADREAARADQGKAPGDLVKENLRLATTIANNYRNIPGVELDDVIQQARIALLHAAQSYDSSRGVPFGLYAGRVMRNASLAMM